MGKGREVLAEGHATTVSHSGPQWWKVLDLDKLPGARKSDGSEDAIRYAVRLLGGRRERPWPDEESAIVSSHGSLEEAQIEAARLNAATKAGNGENKI